MTSSTQAADALTARRRPRRVSSRREAALLVALLVLVGGSVFLSLAVGAREIALDDVWRAIVGAGNGEDGQVVITQRWPRTLTGIAVGLALGVAGALTQGLTRNALADPGLLGVSAGAAFSVVVGISAFGVTASTTQVWFAFAGALLASVVVFVLGATRASSRSSGRTPVTLVLTGMAVTAFLTAMTNALTLLDTSTLDAFRFWNAGALAGRDLDVVGAVAPFLVLGAVLAVATIPGLNALALGDDVARALGQRVVLARTSGLVAVALLCGGSVAAAGPLVFVGLVAPHVARGIVGPDYRRLVPCAAAVGVVLVLISDALGRIVARPDEVPVGVVVGVLGTPLFVILARRRRTVAL